MCSSIHSRCGKTKFLWKQSLGSLWESDLLLCICYVPVLCVHVFLQLLSHSDDGADHFLDSLLNACESVSGSSSPLWVPSPSDSGISDDPLSDHLDSPPPPANLLFDSFFISQHHHPLPVFPPPQSQQQQYSGWASSSSERDISIDVGKKPWFNKPFKVVKEQGKLLSIYELASCHAISSN